MFAAGEAPLTFTNPSDEGRGVGRVVLCGRSLAVLVAEQLGVLAQLIDSRRRDTREGRDALEWVRSAEAVVATRSRLEALVLAEE